MLGAAFSSNVSCHINCVIAERFFARKCALEGAGCENPGRGIVVVGRRRQLSTGGEERVRRLVEGMSAAWLYIRKIIRLGEAYVIG